jgi:hypothetical protein
MDDQSLFEGPEGAGFGARGCGTMCCGRCGHRISGGAWGRRHAPAHHDQLMFSAGTARRGPWIVREDGRHRSHRSLRLYHVPISDDRLRLNGAIEEIALQVDLHSNLQTHGVGMRFLPRSRRWAWPRRVVGARKRSIEVAISRHNRPRWSPSA